MTETEILKTGSLNLGHMIIAECFKVGHESTLYASMPIGQISRTLAAANPVTTTILSTMKCAQLEELAKHLVIREQEIPEPPEKGLVVETSYAGICHSDLHIQDNKIALGGDRFIKFSNLPNFKLPVVMGHEISGVIQAMGNDTEDGSNLQVGDRVIVYPWIGCSETDCGVCEQGAGNICCRGNNQIGLFHPGGYSTHVVVPERKYVVKLPDSIPLDLACMLPCSGLTAYNAVKQAQPSVDKFTSLKGGSTVLVIGAGGLGMWCLQIAKAILPSSTRIIFADVSEEKLSTVRANGADATVLWGEEEESILVSRTLQEGIENTINVTIDFVNSSVTSQRASNCLKKGGTMVCVGLFGGALVIPLPQLVLQTRTIVGCYVGSLSDLQEFVQVVALKQIKPPPLEYIRLEEINTGVERLRKGEIIGRCLIRCKDQ